MIFGTPGQFLTGGNTLMGSGAFCFVGVPVGPRCRFLRRPGYLLTASAPVLPTRFHSSNTVSPSALAMTSIAFSVGFACPRSRRLKYV